jgi:hypothetical protein
LYISAGRAGLFGTLPSSLNMKARGCGDVMAIQRTVARGVACDA